MVDTALAADMVLKAHQDRGDWIVLVTEDDDLIPPLLVAEATIDVRMSRALLLSNRALGGAFVDLSNLRLI